jgi:benzoyl-CoA reductase subunit D
MAGRFARLLLSLRVEGAVYVSGGLAADDGLVDAMQRALRPQGARPAAEVLRHPLSVFAGAIGAALWGAFRREKVGMGGPAWTATTVA